MIVYSGGFKVGGATPKKGARGKCLVRLPLGRVAPRLSLYNF